MIQAIQNPKKQETRQDPSYWRLPGLKTKLDIFKRFGYEPTPKQMLAHKALYLYRYVVVAAGARGGKSMLAGAEIAFELLFPDRRIWCVSSEYDLADKEWDWAREFLGLLPYRDKKVIDFCRVSSAAKGSKAIITPWGSFCKTKTTKNAKGLLGEALDRIWIGEASQVQRDAWYRQLLMRLSNRIGAMGAVSTPNSDAGLFMEFYNMGQDIEFKEWYSYQFSTYDNPTIDKSELDANRKIMDEKTFREQVLGEFVSRRTAVFYIDESNYCNSLPKSAEHYPVIVGIYHKSNNPFSVVFCKYSVDLDTYWIIDEISLEGGTARDVVPLIKERFSNPEKLRGSRWKANIIDSFNSSLESDMENAGLSVITNSFESDYSKNQAVSRQIQLMQNILKPKPDGSPRILFLRDKVPMTIESFKNSTWPDSNEEKGREDRELPLDRNLALARATSFICGYVENAQGRWW